MKQDFPIPPYAAALGIELFGEENGVPVLCMNYGEHVMGRPGFLHGGAISGLLEMAAISALMSALSASDPTAKIKPVNVTVDFMRGGMSQPTYAIGKITRLGGRLANIEAYTWQQDRQKFIAMAQMHYLISREPKET